MSEINIRHDIKLAGFFTSDNKTILPGSFNIKDGNIYIYLIGNGLVNKCHEYVQSSNNGNIFGKLENGMNFVSKNFSTFRNTMRIGGINSLIYKIYSFTEFDKSNTSINYRNYGKVILNIDRLSHYMYMPQVFSDSEGIVIGDIKYNNHTYTLYSNYTSNSLNMIGSLKTTNQRWINLAFSSVSDNWDDYENLIPLFKEILKFMRLMTRINVTITNVKEITDHMNFIFVPEASSLPKERYFGRNHYLSYMYNSNHFCNILNNFLNKDIHLNSLIVSFLSTVNTNHVFLDIFLINLTNGIQSYYSDSENYTGHSLFHKLEYLLYSTPSDIYSIILGNIDDKKFAKNIKDTRNYLVHGSNEGNAKILKGVNLSMDVIMLKWLVYDRILLDLGFSKDNIYLEIKTYIKGIHKDDYVRTRF